MGREIRMVPPNWAHPKRSWPNYRMNRMEEQYQPLYNKTYKKAAEDWKREFAEFYAKGEDKEHECEFWEWDGGPPDKEYYRTYEDIEATWYCLYETVSEGTPVTPPFATKEELADYLAENGDFWDQSRRAETNPVLKSVMPCEPWGKEAAYKFVFGTGWMPSMMVNNGKILYGAELAVELNPGGKK